MVRLFKKREFAHNENATDSELRFDPLYWNQNGIVILLSSQCQANNDCSNDSSRFTLSSKNIENSQHFSGVI